MAGTAAGRGLALGSRARKGPAVGGRARPQRTPLARPAARPDKAAGLGGTPGPPHSIGMTDRTPLPCTPGQKGSFVVCVSAPLVLTSLSLEALTFPVSLR